SAACASESALRAASSCALVASFSACRRVVRARSSRATFNALCACRYALRVAGSVASCSKASPRFTRWPASAPVAVTSPACGRLSDSALRLSAPSCPNATTVAWNVCRTGIVVWTSIGGCVSPACWPEEHPARSKTSPPTNANERRWRPGRRVFVLFIGVDLRLIADDGFCIGCLRPMAHQRIQRDRGFVGVLFQCQQGGVGGQRVGTDREVGGPVEATGGVVGFGGRARLGQSRGVFGQGRVQCAIALQILQQLLHVVAIGQQARGILVVQLSAGRALDRDVAAVAVEQRQ